MFDLPRPLRRFQIPSAAVIAKTHRAVDSILRRCRSESPSVAEIAKDSANQHETCCFPDTGPAGGRF